MYKQSQMPDLDEEQDFENKGGSSSPKGICMRGSTLLVCSLEKRWLLPLQHLAAPSLIYFTFCKTVILLSRIRLYLIYNWF